MMKEEFEKLAGYKVSFDDYNRIIEPMYMATDLSKDEFVQCINKEKFALPTRQKLLRKMRSIASHLQTVCGTCVDSIAEETLEKLAHQYVSIVHGLDWVHDITVACYFIPEYEYPNVKRGGKYPKTLVICHGNNELERIWLIKEEEISHE